LFIAAGMFIFGMLIVVFKDIIFLLLESSCRQASGISSFLILMPIMYTVSEVTVVGINFKKKTYWHTLIATISVGANIFGNFIFVPIYGAKGAALSTGISYIIFFSMRTLISRRLFKVNYHLGKFRFSTVIFVVVAFINTFVNSLFLQILSAMIGLILVLIVYCEQVRYVFDFAIEELKRLKNKVINNAT